MRSYNVFDAMCVRISFASDHGGFALRKGMIAVVSVDHNIFDRGCHDELSSVDYPDYSNLVVRDVLSNSVDIGVLICTSGIGMSMAANRYSKIRAALCRDVESAVLSRSHNNANIICLGAKFTSLDSAIGILKAFIGSAFSDGRHRKRVNKFNDLGRDFVF